MSNGIEKMCNEILKQFQFAGNYTNLSVGKTDPSIKKNYIRNLGLLLRNQTLRIVTTQNKPLHYAEKVNETWIGKGAAFEIIEYVRDHYKFNYTVTVHNDQVLGNESEGIFKVLNNNEADIAAAFLPIISGAEKSLDYSPVLDLGEWMVLMKRPSESATGSGLLAPFTTDVWILILVSVICMGPIVSLLIYWHKKLCPGEQTVTHSLLECVWFVYGAIIKQGSVMYPTANSTRVLFTVWWIFITILTAFYTANLTAFLTLSIFTLPVSEPKDIGAQRYSWLTDEGNVIQRAMNDEPLKNSKATYIQNWNTSVIMEEYIKGKNYLYFNDRLILEDMMYNDYMNKTRYDIPESERCVFVITTWPVFTVDRAFAYRKNFTFKPVFDKILLHLVECGVVKFKSHQHLGKATVCPLNLKSTERQLRNTDFLLTYYIISGGFGSSVLSFAIEVLIGLYYRFKTNRAKKMNAEASNMPPNPPPYHTLFKEPFNYPFDHKENINEQDYWVVPSERVKGIVPMRAVSAMKFQYTQ